MSDDITLEYVSQTEESWPADMYAALLREPSKPSVVTLSGFADRHGNDQELCLRPPQARSLAAALVQLADSAEHGR
ncbi:hypothetical protein [Pseudokineococcus sp. 1T1Z-3]|uniref:hypothetical protein n=1 Tax=Pseudokineococcus sp. 1T1Z-3 TaxID=3132745 RepID=UPI0030B64B1D